MKTYYDFHPRSIMTLGGGFSPNTLDSAKLRAISFESLPAEGGALNTDSDVWLVRDSTQLKQTMHIDLSVDASYLTFGGGVSFSYDDSYAFDSESITVVSYSRTEFGRLTMKNAALTAAAKSLIDNRQMKEFEQAYGTNYVVMERRGAAVYVIITIANVAQSTQTRINAGTQGHGGWGPLSASAKATLQLEIQQAVKEQRVQVQVVATGGDGFGGLSNTLKALTGQTDVFAQITDAVGTFMKQFNASNSAPLGFYSASMTDFGWTPDQIEDIYSEEKERKLLVLVDAYRHAQTKLARIDAILRGEDPVSRILTPAQRDEIQKARGQYDLYLSAVASQYEKCRTSNSQDGCEMPTIVLPPDSLIPAAPVPHGTWRVIKSGSVWDVIRSWQAISAYDNYMNNPSQPESDLLPDEVYFVLDAPNVYEIDVRFDENAMATYRRSGSDSTINLQEFHELKMLAYIGEQIKAGREEEAGTFNLLVKDLFGASTRIDLLNAAWEKYDRPPQKWRITRYDRIPYGVTSEIAEQQTATLARIFRKNNMLSELFTLSPRATSVHDACESAWDGNKSDCSAFVRQVAQTFGLSLVGNADVIINAVAAATDWAKLTDGPEAAAAAADGFLVLAGLKGEDHLPPREHGHVAIVVAGPLAQELYPTAYWGSLGSVGRKETTLNFAWNPADRDNVAYFSHVIK